MRFSSKGGWKKARPRWSEEEKARERDGKRVKKERKSEKEKWKEKGGRGEEMAGMIGKWHFRA